MRNTRRVPAAPQPENPARANASSASEGSLPLRIKLSYGAPGFAGAALAIPIAVHLSIFYSDVILVPLGFVALVKAVARAFDALTDPLMGWVTDRTRTRWGRRRPYIALGAPIAGLCFIGMFAPPASLAPLQAATWFAITYVLYYIFHTVYQIPHYGLGPEITQDYRQRASLFGWSEGFSVAGTLVAAALPWVLEEALGSERAAMLAFAVIFATLLALLYWNLVAQIRERPDYVNRAPNPLVPGMRRVMRNRVFRMLLFIYLIGSITGAIPGTMMPYFTKYVLKPDDYGFTLAILLVTYFGSAFLCMPLWVWAVKRFGKKPVWIFSFVSSVAGLLGLFLLVGEGDVGVMVAVLVWTGSTFSARLLLGPAIQADVIDYDELYTGKRREAQYGGLWSIMTKFTVIPSMSIPLAVLATLGYEPNVAQSETVEFAIRAIFALAPAATALLALPLAIAYPINESVHREILDCIERHKSGESAIDPVTGVEVPPPASRGVDEDTGWFLDHFSERELERSAAGRSLVPGTLVAACVSLCVCVGAGLMAAGQLGDLEREPGLQAVLEILVAGIGLTAFIHHGVRTRAALKLRERPPSASIVREHVRASRSERPSRRRLASITPKGAA